MSQGNQSLATRGPGQHLLPVLEEATSDGATLVIVFISTVIVTDPRSISISRKPSRTPEVLLPNGSGIRSGVYLIPPYRSQSYLLLPVQVPLRFIVLRADKSSNVGYYTNSIFIEFYYLTNRHTIFHFSSFLIF